MVHRQPSAAPFHDWNTRISDECYERLGGAGVRGPDGRLYALVNLFGRISFNIGPTLALWLERNRPEVLEDATKGDQAAALRTGAGPAMMQAYGHPILPLCEPREKRLQIAWGRTDFMRRFERPPRGIWLPETAVDIETLEACADFGLEYTILAPEQVLQIRPLDKSGDPHAWEDVSGGRVPTQRPLRVRLPSGRDFTVFVFNGDISRGIAFGGVLHSGESLVGRLREGLDSIGQQPGMLLLAADGETFGHHQRGAEEALAEALVRCRMAGLAKICHPGELLDELPPTHEARLATPSSWSCPHGVGRWFRDCGCHMADRPEGWSWEWRATLRQAVTSLRDRVFALIDRRGSEILDRPWHAAESYGEVLAAPRSTPALEGLLARHLPEGAEGARRQRAAMLLELLRQTLFSATSCGWFFDDIAGIEATQVLRHAARAAELAEKVFGINVEEDLITRLREAKANDPAFETGADVYRQKAASARHDAKVALEYHALAHLRTALSGGSAAVAAVSRSFGLFTTNDLETPQAGIEPNGLVRVSGRGSVGHLRTLETWEGSYEALSESPGLPTELLIDSHPTEEGCPAIRELMLTIGARRAAALLPAPDADVLRRISWAAKQARELGAYLPSPFPEAIQGGARALLLDRLTRQPANTGEEIEALREGLEAAEGAGLTSPELADLRPRLDRRLALLTETVLLRDREDRVEILCRLLRLARDRTGEEVLARSRRVLGSRPYPMDRSLVVRIATAAGMAPDALTPVDIPVLVARDPRARFDDLA